jgi:hypothetical protein
LIFFEKADCIVGLGGYDLFQLAFGMHMKRLVSMGFDKHLIGAG